MKLQYMAWLRNRAGKAKETIDLPEGVTTLEQLVGWMSAQNTSYQTLFSYRSIISASINGEMVQDWNVVLDNDDEISFFSPMAGG